MAKPDPNLYLGLELNDRYEIQRFIASGGFCLVYEACDQKENRQVAIKILSHSASTEDRIEFEMEKQLLDRFSDSSHIVDCFGGDQETIAVTIQETGGVADLPLSYIVLELAVACLVDLVVRRQQVSWNDRLHLLRDVTKGLHQMHLAEAVHRDVKSENALVMFNPPAETIVKLADLGRGKVTTATPRFAEDAYERGRGDLRFAPPELLWRLGVDQPTFWRRTDLYLLGSTFFELATGQGITPLALGNPFHVLEQTRNMRREDRERIFANQIANIRGHYEHALTLFGAELPAPIRYEGVRLVRQLCNPEPAKREKPFGRKDVSTRWSLERVLRRIDIMIHLLNTAA